MLATTSEFVPAIDPAELADNPRVAKTILRQVMAWLAEHTAGLSVPEQRDLARRTGVAAGIYATEYPVEYGGWGFSETATTELREEAAASGKWYSRFVLSNFHGPSRILMDATEQQKEKFLRPLVQGRWTRSLAMTEETGGSDLTHMGTTAVRTPDGRWKISGRKFLIGNAAYADVAVVLANAIGGGSDGPTFFVFTTDTPGWKVGRRLPGMDPYYFAFEVELDGIEVGDDAIIGGPSHVGGGIGKVSEWMAHGRLIMAARAVGLGRFALGVARRYAKQRVIGKDKLSDKQYIREFLVRSDVKIEASRCLVRQAAAAVDNGRAAVREAAVAKLFATESACEIIDDAIQTLGGRGWLEEYGLEPVYREARAFRIADGASELLKETIFHLPGEWS